MRLSRAELLLTLALFGAARLAGAQSTAGTIRGHVSDAGGLSVPGATVTVTSPNLQMPRLAVSSENGDYIFTLLPPGPYRAQFELTGFQTVERDITLAPTQVLPLDVVFNPAKVEESIDVVGASANVLGRTAQVATSFQQTLISALPMNRDVSSTMLLAPGVHQTGPNGAYTIAGSVSFENHFMVNGVSVVENLRGQPYDMYVEDAIQETTVASAGVSAEYGRFTGGVVNIITKSGGNRFSGSFRDTLQNDKWRALTPFEDTQLKANPALKDTRVAKTVPAYEYTFGGPAMKDRLWFFTAGRAQEQQTARATVDTNIPYIYTIDSKRFEFNGTYSLSANHRVQGVYILNNEIQTNASQNPATVLDLNSLYNPDRLMNLSTVNYSGIITPRLFLEARVSARNETIKKVGGRSTNLVDGTLLVTRNQRRFWAPTFCGVCDPGAARRQGRVRQSVVFPFDEGSRLA
jgi:hypothetical protein